MSEWVDVKERLPQSQVTVLIAIKNAYNGSYSITTGAHINDHEVTTEEYGWQDYEGDTEYDEDNDCFWVKEGWWESNYVEDNANWEIDSVDGIVTHWMPLPDSPGKESIEATGKIEIIHCGDCRDFDDTGYENPDPEMPELRMGYCRSWRRDTQACVFCSHRVRKER